MSCFAGPEPVTSGLVLHLDAANPRSYPGSGTAWNDLSGNGNNGTLINSPTYSSNNKGTIVFDGTNDYVSIPVSCNKTYFSINWWLYPNTRINANQQMFFNIFNWGAFVFHTDSVGAVLIGTDLATRMSSTELPADTLITSIWQNFTFTFDNGIGKFYKNGLLIGTKSGIAISATNYTTFYIGINGANTINGYLPSISIYSNKILSAAEITQNFEATRSRYGI
jgi:hypothetical protein